MPSAVSYSHTPIATDQLFAEDFQVFDNFTTTNDDYTHVTPDFKDPSVPRDFLLDQQNLLTAFQSPPQLTLDRFPPEVLQQIFYHVLVSSGETGQRNLARLAPVCFKFYQIAIPLLYRHVTITYSRSFGSFSRALEETGFGEFVKVLNFSSFTSVGLGRTGNMNREIQNLTSSTIFRVLELCPNLEEFLACESIDSDIDVRVINKLLSMPYVSSMDFCGSTMTQELLNSNLVMSNQMLPQLKNLSLHGCSTIPASALQRVLSKLEGIERLDLTHTLVDADALLSIPESASLTHLSLGKCNQLTSNSLVKFLLLHPATRHLEWLNIMFDVSKPSPLSEEDFETILRYLPSSLEYINLYGLPVKEKYLRYLIKLTKLSGLSLGFANLSAEALYRNLPLFKELRYLDLSGNPHVSLWVLHDPNFYNLNPKLEVIELRNDRVEKVAHTTLGEGWNAEVGQGRRGWLYRLPNGMSARQSSKPVPRKLLSHRARFSSGPTAKSSLMSRINFAEEPAVNVPLPKVESSEAWVLYASRKINMNQIGLGGYDDMNALKQRGIYGYYAYHLN